MAELLEAEAGAEAICGDQFDYYTNNCVHYASSLWRSLQFEETEELGTFLVEQIMSRPGFSQVLQDHLQPNEGRNLVANPDSLIMHLIESVHSQLEL